MDTVPSPQGIIDEFFERKWADARTWRRTNGDAVILVDLTYEERCFPARGRIECSVIVSDFSHPPYAEPEIRWELTGEVDEILKVAATQ